jgi:aspartyl-tRNA(Asn)/glutamyl-tRNA(Gln) amidotransferase subunit B
MRKKEDAHDYRYFPDPDLPALRVTPQTVEHLRQRMPELPRAKRTRYQSVNFLTQSDANRLVEDIRLSTFFDEIVFYSNQNFPSQDRLEQRYQIAANFVLQEIARWSKEQNKPVGELGVRAPELATLVEEVLVETISISAAKQVIHYRIQNPKEERDIPGLIDHLGLRQVNDSAAIDQAIDEVLIEFPNQSAEVRAGKTKVIGFLVGQLMKKTGGKINPAKAQELLKKRLL